MKNLIQLVQEKYTKEEVNLISKNLELIKDFNYNYMYNFNFCVQLATDLVVNNLDIDAVIAGLIYPLILCDDKDVLGVQSQETIRLIETLLDLNELKISNRDEQANSIKNMFIAIAKDLRTIIIKLSLEKRKVYYLGSMSEKEKELLFDSYVDIYIPISSMLGIYSIKDVLEDSTFKYYNPKEYTDLKKIIDTYVAKGSEQINSAIENLKQNILPILPDAMIYGRQKKLSSIAKKLQSKQYSINSITEIYGKGGGNASNYQIDPETVKSKGIVDILALRVLVNSVEDCYTCLGKIYTIFTPLGNFKDYIASPKDNGYQSLHILVSYNSSDPIEIQIRTFDMHNYAEYGYAAHWAYKTKQNVEESGKKINQIRRVLDYYKDKNNDQLLNVLKTNIYADKIFVQTPQGRILEFPVNATPIDFAYSIHSKVGNSCVGAKINGRIVPLSTSMKNNDVVEIITSSNAKGPSRDWLKICKTNSAKQKINQFLKVELRDYNIKKGKSIIEQYAKVKGYNLTKLMKDEYLSKVLLRYSLKDVNEMYSIVGHGSLTAGQIVNKLDDIYRKLHQDEIINDKIKSNTIKKTKSQGSIKVEGYSDMPTKFAKCCNPLPGDEIIGYISRGNGITVHRKDCPSIKHYEQERLMNCTWNNAEGSNFIGSVSILVKNVQGVLSTISKKINDLKMDIVGITSKMNSDKTAIIYIQVSINKKEELEDLINKMSNFNFVIDIFRS